MWEGSADTEIVTAAPWAAAVPSAAFADGPPGPESPLDAASLLADDAARFCEVNDQAVNLLHYPREELLQMRVWDITPELQRPDALELWKAFILVGEQAGVYQARRRDGRLITVEYVAVANYRPGAHLSVLRPIGRTMAAGRSLDECPYERPFPPGFRSCPAYQPHLTYEADSRGDPVAPVWTCQHLGAGRHRGGRGFFGRCGVGDALARTRWLAGARTTHLRAIQELRFEAADLVGPALETLYRARAERDGSGRLAPDSQTTEQASVGVTRAFAAFAGERSDRLQAAGIDPEELSRCFAATIKDFGRSSTAEGWVPPASIVSGYPPGIRAFLRPDLFAIVELHAENS
jgi:PAS domain S-box-containing protein